MSAFAARPSTAFQGDHRIAHGALAEVAPVVRAALDREPDVAVLVFDDATGAVIDLDLRGSDDEIVARLRGRDENGGARDGLREIGEAPAAGTPASRRGRPKLGVVSREVTLLPRHWEWLAAQPGGASNALRRLTEAAMRSDQGAGRARARREAVYRFMSAMAGDLPGFEEASRALFAGDRHGFAVQADGWPEDVRNYAMRLAWA